MRRRRRLPRHGEKGRPVRGALFSSSAEFPRKTALKLGRTEKLCRLTCVKSAFQMLVSRRVTPNQIDDELFSQIEANQKALKTLIDDSARMSARADVLVGYVRAQEESRGEAKLDAP